MAIRRMSRRERADIAAEKQHRRHQTPADLEEEKAQRRAEDHAERVNIRLIKDYQPYRGRHQL